MIQRIAVMGLVAAIAGNAWQYLANANLEGEVSQLQADKAHLEAVRDWSLNTVNEQGREIDQLIAQRERELQISAAREQRHTESQARLEYDLAQLRKEKQTNETYRNWANQPLPDVVYRMQFGTAGEDRLRHEDRHPQGGSARAVHAGHAGTTDTGTDKWRTDDQNEALGGSIGRLQHRQAAHTPMGDDTE